MKRYSLIFLLMMFMVYPFSAWDPDLYTLGIKLPDGKVREEKVDIFPS